MVNLHALSLSFPFQDTLRNGGYDTVMPSLDLVESGSKSLIVVMKLRRPVSCIIHRGKVSAVGPLGGTMSISIAIAIGISVHQSRTVALVSHPGLEL